MRNSRRASQWLRLVPLSLAGVLAVGLPLASAQTISTDQTAYRSGNTVSISGAGWQPGESVNLNVSETPATDPDMAIVVNADSNGKFENEGYAIPDDATASSTYVATASDASGASATANFSDPKPPPPAATGALCAAITGHGASICPTATGAAGVLGQGVTHYSQAVGTTATYQIIWPADSTTDYVQEATCTDNFGNSIANGVKVEIKSSTLGNSIVCGSVDGTGKIITFSWTAPANGCQTTVVAYKTGVTGGGADQFTNASNDIVDDDTLDGTPTATAGIGYVAPGTSDPALTCNGTASANATTQIKDANGNVITTGTAPLTVHDSATVTGSSGTPTGTVSFTFYSNGSCDGTGTDAGTVALNGSGVAEPSTTEGPLSAGSYSFKATYSGDSTYAGAVSSCELLTVVVPTQHLVLATQVDQGADEDSETENVSSVPYGSSVHDHATLTGSGGALDGNLAINFYSGRDCSGEATSVGSESVSGNPVDFESSSQSCLNAGAYSFRAVYTLSADDAAAGYVGDNGGGAGDTVAGACEPFAVTPINPQVGTQILLQPIDAIVTSVTMGAVVSDELDVNDPTTCGSTPTGTADFTFFSDSTCSNPAASPPAQSPNPELGLALSGSGGESEAESDYTSPLTVGSYSYSASYESTNPNFNSITSSCEPLKVVSSISDLHYDITTTSNYGNPSGPWYCHSLSSTTSPAGSGPDPATCPNSEGSVQLSTKTNKQVNNFLITATLNDNTGGSITELVKGALPTGATYADSSGNPYTPVAGLITIKASDITPGCGAAVLTVPATGAPVLYWNKTGTVSVKRANGFTMTQGETCQLKVMVIKDLRALGNQEISKPFNECQWGPSYSFSAVSPSTGQLLVNVKP